MDEATSLFKFKAGKSRLDGKLLVADTRKGMVEVFRDQDGLVHFTWGVRQEASDAASKPEPEVDLVLFPGQATFSKLGGRRMFLLKYEKEEHFFWSQEPDNGQDEQTCKTVHECINSFVPEREKAHAHAEQSDEEADEEMVARALEGEAEEAAAQPQQIEADDEQASQSQQGIQAADLARVLGKLQPQQAQGQPVNAAALAAALSGMGGASSSAMQMQRAPGPSLAEILNPETIIPLLRQPGMLDKLAQYLPEEQRTDADLADLAESAQLHHQLRVLGAALQTAQLDPAQFGLNATGYSVVEFFEAIQRKVDEERKDRAS